MELETLWRMVGVTVTPFSGANKPDLEEIAAQTERLAASPVDGILPCASTGEAVKMDPEDRLRVLETVAQANQGRKVLLAGACDSSASGVLRSVEAAKRLNYEACVVCPPYYYGLSQQAVFDFYREICAAAEQMPIIGYHVPFFTTGIEIPTFLRLLELDNFVGMKDSSANLKRIAHLCDLAAAQRPAFRVYTGTDDCLLSALCVGCAGSMTAFGASLPKQIAAIYDAFDQRNLPEAMERQRSILPILRVADVQTFPDGYKLLAKAAGLHLKQKIAQEETVYPQLCAMLKTLREKQGEKQ